MRKFISLIAFVVSLSVNAQMFEAPTHASTREEFTDTTTTFTYKMNEKVYDVYRTRNGAYYIYKISKKSGKLYKYYLPKIIQSKMGRKYDK
jgi:hypothetical protein